MENLNLIPFEELIEDGCYIMVKNSNPEQPLKITITNITKHTMRIYYDELSRSERIFKSKFKEDWSVVEYLSKYKRSTR